MKGMTPKSASQFYFPELQDQCSHDHLHYHFQSNPPEVNTQPLPSYPVFSNLIIPSLFRKHHPSLPSSPPPRKKETIINQAPSPTAATGLPALQYAHSYGRCSNSLEKPPNQSSTSRPFSSRLQRCPH